MVNFCLLLEREAGDMASEGLPFKTFFVKRAASICNNRVVIACHGRNPGSLWQTLIAAMLKTVLLNLAVLVRIYTITYGITV